MEILDSIFRIGVILAVYNFLWWLIEGGLTLLRGGKSRLKGEVYLLKAIRYLFLADVIFLFFVGEAGGLVLLNDIFLASIILLLYFIGKIQKKQLRNSFFTIRTRFGQPDMNSMLKAFQPIFDMRLEIIVVVLSIALFPLFYFFPQLANNAIANWFLGNILGIEQAPIFGFIFKVIGFFFLVSILLKVLNSFLAVLTGGFRKKTEDNDQQKDDNDFDDFIEIK